MWNPFMQRAPLILLILLTWRLPAGAQVLTSRGEIAEPPVLVPEKTKGVINVDGVLNEVIWTSTSGIGNFWQVFPTDTLKATGQTEVRMAYDEAHLYVAVRCYSRGNDFVVSSLKRDYDFPGSDNVTLVFDTYNDKTNAFVFGLNPYGVQREALIANGGRDFDDFASSWDNKWRGEARMGDDYWTAEFAIPFSTLRYQEGGTEWRFNCYRSDTQINEWSSWMHIPRNLLVMDLAFMGTIIWPEPLPRAGANISAIPYVTAGGFRDFELETQGSPDYNTDIGGDAKVAITSGLNLDLTVNPDFSQVEVDEQVTNLDRFEIFFPERRQFFLENADLFGGFGLRRVNPFFSRRIGVAIDTSTGQNVQNPIHYGVRLSGKLNEDLRIGLLNMQTAKLEESGLPIFNFTVATLQQQVFNRSNLSFIFVNKQAINGQNSNGEFNRYNRVAGLEYRLATPDNSWTGKIFYHHSFSSEQRDHPFAHGLQVEYLKRKYRLEWAHTIIGNGFEAEAGFVPRRDYILISPEAEWFFYPRSGIINQHSISLDTRFFFQIGKDGNEILAPYTLSERQTELSWNIDFSNNTRGGLQVEENELTLLRDFDPTRLQADSISLPAGSTYHFTSVSGEYESDQRHNLFFEIAPTVGQFYNGFRAGVAGGLTYRFQPYGSVALNVDYNYIKLEKPFEPVSIWLVGPRIDLTFTKSLFLTTFIQYNNQLDNLNINTRLQWRFAPVSDFFLVYTDNYLAESFSQFGVRNRALVAKVTYWLNL
jgi:hypothetical protein